MQIDWLTVAAQIVNFLLLVWLLKRFLYKPIADAMQRRESRIESRLAEARAALASVDAEAQRLKGKEEALDAARDRMLEEARREAGALGMRLEAEIREKMEERRTAWRDRLEEERDAHIAAIRRQAGRQVLDIAGRVLADYADSDLTERVVATFATRLAALDPQIRDRLSRAAADPRAPARIETATLLDSGARERLARAVHEILSTEIAVEYETYPALILGIRLTIGENTVEWSAVRYLARLETELGEIIDAGRRAASPSRADLDAADRKTA